jgi:hypothetical protein
MTDARRPAQSHRPAKIAYTGSIAVFAAVLGFLGWQVAAGHDPALGSAF